MTKVIKEWGTEYWLVNEPEYCAKYLDLKVGKQCSLHYHPIKKETFVVETGLVKLQRLLIVGDTIIETLTEHLQAGDSRTILPGTPHRFCAEGDYGARILEVSTHHSDEDVTRLEPSGDITGDW